MHRGSGHPGTRRGHPSGHLGLCLRLVFAPTPVRITPSSQPAIPSCGVSWALGPCSPSASRLAPRLQWAPEFIHRGWSGGERRKGKGRERGRGRRVEKGREEVSNHHPARATTPGAGCGATPIWAHGPGWGPARIQVPAKSARLPWDSGGSCSGQGETLEAEKAGRAGARPAPWPHSQDRGLCSEITLVAGPAPREAPGLAGCGRGAGPGQYLLNLLQVS